MDRLLLLSCSRSKRSEPDLLPAYERYNGPVFHLLRRYLRSSTNTPAIKILSAEFGLIPYDFRIPYYDRRMTVQRARELEPKVTKALKRVIGAVGHKQAQDIFILWGRDYFKAAGGLETHLSDNRVKIANGTPGERLTDLYKWLYGNPPAAYRNTSTTPKGNVRIRGVEINITAEEILDKVRDAMTSGLANLNCQAWYVSVDGQRVPVKWLVSMLTGMPHSSFHTDEAKRVLSQLGLKVQSA